MKNSILLLIISSLSYSCTELRKQDQANARIEYYTQLSGIISPYLSYKGRGQVTLGQAKELKHYVFSYGDDGRLNSIKYFDKQNPSVNAYYGTHQVIYHYGANSLERTYWDVNGERSTLWRHYYLGEGLHKEIFELDSVGNKRALALYDTLGNRMVSGLGAYRFEFETIDENRFIQKQFDQSNRATTLTGYFPFRTSLISVDNLGFLETISNIDSARVITLNKSAGYSQVVFDYDEFGNELGWSFYKERDELANRESLNDMDYNFAKVAYSFDWIDRRLGTYTSFRESYFDEAGEPTLTNQGVHSLSYQFDSSDRLLSISYYGLNEQAVEHSTLSYHAIHYEYDADGRGKLKFKLDKNLNPI